MKNDFILDTVETFGKNLGKTMMNTKEEGQVVEIENMTDKDILIIYLKRLLVAKKYSDAEDLLFSYINDENEYIDEVAMWFYKTLEAKDDKDLLSNNFSRNEIFSGLEAFKNKRK